MERERERDRGVLTCFVNFLTRNGLKYLHTIKMCRPDFMTAYMYSTSHLYLPVV